MRLVTLLVAAVAALSALPGSLRAQATPAPLAALTDASPLFTSHPLLRASLERLTRRSPLWRADVDALSGSGRRVLVLTPDQVLVANSPEQEGTEPFDRTVVAAAAPVPGQGSAVNEVLVVVNVPLIVAAHRGHGSMPGEIDVDLDRILAHEVYGHALPYLLAGDLSGRCADPLPRQRPADACAIRRENAIRAELGLGLRKVAGLEGLLLARAIR